MYIVINALEAVEYWLKPQTELGEQKKVVDNLEAAHQIRAADVETTPDGSYELRQGVAKERRISIEDPQMRHGRKSRSLRVDGYKRHIFRDLDNGLVRT